jgi:hypothetical protein
MDSYERGVVISEPLRKHVRIKCFDPCCAFESVSLFFVKHEGQHLAGKFACGACGLRHYHGIGANEHALRECRVEDAATIHIPPPMEVVCTEPRCGHWRENTDLGNANTQKHFEAQHVKGKGH